MEHANYLIDINKHSQKPILRIVKMSLKKVNNGISPQYNKAKTCSPLPLPYFLCQKWILCILLAMLQLINRFNCCPQRRPRTFGHLSLIQKHYNQHCHLAANSIPNSLQLLTPHTLYRIFRTISRNFFQKFQGSGLYSGATYVRTILKNHTLHATACLDQHLITISSPTVLHNHW